MGHYVWAAKGVNSPGVDTFAALLEETLNKLEADEFEIYNIMDAPIRGGSSGVVVIGRKPQRFTSRRPDNGSATLDPVRLKGRL